MKIQLLIFIYIYISVCIVLFDLLYSGYSRYKDHRHPGLQRRLHELIQKQSENGRYGKDTETTKLLYRQLRPVSNLLVLMEMIQQPEENPGFRSWTRANIALFARLEQYYRRKKPENRAFFCYILACLPFDPYGEPLTANQRNQLSAICRGLATGLREPSIYLRENTLQAILKLGTTQDLLPALELLNDHPNHQNEKLLTDNLLGFAGSHPQMSDGLWELFDSLTIVMQIAFINYLRLLPATAIQQSRYFERLLRRLEDAHTHKEIRFAILRYFGKYTYPQVYPLLLAMVRDPNELNWSYAAIAATSLSRYPGAETEQALRDAMSSPNWYLRFNASESLIGMGVDVRTMIDSTTDSYGSEMMEYRLQVHEMKEKGRVKI